MIIGSSAAYYHGLTSTHPMDFDRFYVEGGDVLSGDSHSLPESIYNSINTIEGFITKDHLYTLKCSHLQWDIKWQKTKTDVLSYKYQGCQLDEKLYNSLVEYWKGLHGDKSFLSLKKSKDGFFEDFVEYVYDHDYLHEVVAGGFNREPLYNKCLKDGEEVLTDALKFNNMSFEEQVAMFREEIAVIAFERWIVHGDVGWFKAHSMSLKKTVTNLTKGWASDFIVKNLEHFVKPNYKYYENLINMEK